MVLSFGGTFVFNVDALFDNRSKTRMVENSDAERNDGRDFSSGFVFGF